MELYVGVIGIIGVVFVVIFGGRGLIDLVRGVIERRRLQGTQVTTEPSGPLRSRKSGSPPQLMPCVSPTR